MFSLHQWLKQSTSILASRVSIQATGALSHLAIIPLMSAPDYGIYILLISIGQLISPLAHAGLIVPMVTEAASQPANRTISLVVYLKLYSLLWLVITALIAFGFWSFLVVNRLSFNANTSSLNHCLIFILILLSCLANAAELIASQLLIAKGKIWQSTLASGGIRYFTITIAIAIMLILDSASISLPTISVITIIACVFAILFCCISFCITVIRDHNEQAPLLANASEVELYTSDAIKIKSILSRSIESLGSFVFSQIRTSIEIVMSAALFGLGTAGVLAAARRLTSAVLMISQALNVVLTPYSVSLIQSQEKYSLIKINRLVAVFFNIALCVFYSDNNYINSISVEYESSFELPKLRNLLNYYYKFAGRKVFVWKCHANSHGEWTSERCTSIIFCRFRFILTHIFNSLAP